MSADFALQQAAYAHADYLVTNGTVYPLPPIEAALCIQPRETGQPSIYQYDISERVFRAFSDRLFNFELSYDKEQSLQVNRREMGAVR